MFDKEHAALARRMALKSTSRFRLGAVIARRSRVVSVGINCMNKTHPISYKYTKHDQLCGTHAEVDALKGLSQEETKRCHIYVARLLRSGKLAMARPCDNCQQILNFFNINKIYYSTEKGWTDL